MSRDSHSAREPDSARQPEPRPVGSAPQRDGRVAVGRSSEPLLEPDERLIVLDDDPTGSQAVHDIQVVGSLNPVTVRAALRHSSTVFFLTNVRAMGPTEAAHVMEQTARAVTEACAELGLRPRFASRSDSTLRGHFPLDVDAISVGAGLGSAATVLLVPCFVDGGRWTFDDVHWVREGDQLVPVGQTPYAGDSSFGFASSRLVDWVEEKAPGRFPSSDMVTIPLAMLRDGDDVAARADAVADLFAAHRGGVIIANALDYDDLDVLARGVRAAERGGETILYRTGASFVRARAGIAPRAALTRADLGRGASDRGGLIVCGSHVPVSTAQVEALLARPDCDGVEIDVPRLLEGRAAAAQEVEEAAQRIRLIVRSGRHAVAYTSRTVVQAGEGQDPLALGSAVSTALVELVRAVRDEPGFLVSKGGITSHDIATKALDLQRGTVLGQVIPGVSAWRVDEGATPGQVLVVFPGNVGDAGSLSAVVDALGAESGP